MSTAVVEKSSSLGVADDDGSPASSVTGEVAASQPDATSVTNSSRLYFLDWIRVVALLTVFIEHFWSQGSDSNITFVTDSLQDAAWLKATFVVIPPLGISVFFLVSGAASIMSLDKRSPKQYLRERVLRLLVPFVVGSVLLVPLAGWLYPWTDFTGSWLEYYPVFFSGVFDGFSGATAPVLAFTIGAWLWLLAFLFAYSIIALPILRWLRSPSADRFIGFTTRIASHRGGLLLWILPVLLLIIVGQLLSMGASSMATEYTGWGAFLRYFGMFVLGAILIRNREVLTYLRRDWALTAGVLLPLLVGAYWFLMHLTDSNPWIENLSDGPFITAGVLIGIMCWCFAILLMAFGMRFWNKPSKALAYCLGIIVAFYVFHQVAINAAWFAYFGRIDATLNNAGQWSYPVMYQENQFLTGVALFVTALLLVIVFIELVIRPIPPLRKLLGVTRERIPGQYHHQVTEQEQRAVDRGDSVKSPLERELVASGENPTRI